MSNQTEIRHFRYFLAVAEELHFRKAAEKLYIAQPGLSRQIKQMEYNLGVQLFIRNNKKVSLTPAGQYLKKELSIALQHIDNILDYARLLNEGQEGHLKMTYVGSAMQNIIPELLIEMRSAYPNIRFTLEEIDNYKQVDALVSQMVDIGFVRLNELPPELNIKPIWREHFALVLPENHPIDQHNFKGIDTLASESFILFDKSYSPAYHGQVMSIFEGAGFIPNVSHNTVHANTIFRLVENNFGIAIVPFSLRLGYDMKVKFIELKNIPQRAVLYMTWSKQNSNPALTKLLTLMGKKEIGEEG